MNNRFPRTLVGHDSNILEASQYPNILTFDKIWFSLGILNTSNEFKMLFFKFTKQLPKFIQEKIFLNINAWRFKNRWTCEENLKYRD